MFSCWSQGDGRACGVLSGGWEQWGAVSDGADRWTSRRGWHTKRAQGFSQFYSKEEFIQHCKHRTRLDRVDRLTAIMQSCAILYSSTVSGSGMRYSLINMASRPNSHFTPCCCCNNNNTGYTFLYLHYTTSTLNEIFPLLVSFKLDLFSNDLFKTSRLDLV